MATKTLYYGQIVEIRDKDGWPTRHIVLNRLFGQEAEAKAWAEDIEDKLFYLDEPDNYTADTGKPPPEFTPWEVENLVYHHDVIIDSIVLDEDSVRNLIWDLEGSLHG